MMWMILTWLSSEITQMNLDIFPLEIMWGCGMTEMSYTMKHLENATNTTMPLTA